MSKNLRIYDVGAAQFDIPVVRQNLPPQLVEGPVTKLASSLATNTTGNAGFKQARRPPFRCCFRDYPVADKCLRDSPALVGEVVSKTRFRRRSRSSVGIEDAFDACPCPRLQIERRTGRTWEQHVVERHQS